MAAAAEFSEDSLGNQFWKCTLSIMHVSSLKAEEFEKFLTHTIVENKHLSNECNLHLWNGYSM